ncbi:hypothetical protein Tco_1039244 [Tanacetum coccineum]
MDATACLSYVSHQHEITVTFPNLLACFVFYLILQKMVMHVLFDFCYEMCSFSPIAFDKIIRKNNWLDHGETMRKKGLAFESESSGHFTTSEDGTLTYNGGEANAANVTSETPFTDLKLRLVEICDLNPLFVVGVAATVATLTATTAAA